MPVLAFNFHGQISGWKSSHQLTKRSPLPLLDDETIEAKSDHFLSKFDKHGREANRHPPESDEYKHYSAHQMKWGNRDWAILHKNPQDSLKQVQYYQSKRGQEDLKSEKKGKVNENLDFWQQFHEIAKSSPPAEEEPLSPSSSHALLDRHLHEIGHRGVEAAGSSSHHMEQENLSPTLKSK